MMNNFSTIGNFGLTYSFGKLFAIAFLIGLIFFIAWALKNLKKEQLLNWAIVLLVIGIIGWLLSASVSGFGMYGHYLKGGAGFQSSMWNCMQDEECHEEMEELMERMMGIE